MHVPDLAWGGEKHACKGESKNFDPKVEAKRINRTKSTPSIRSINATTTVFHKFILNVIYSESGGVTGSDMDNAGDKSCLWVKARS
jgi:hypothetical protein